jgi:hypothetical protein
MLSVRGDAATIATEQNAIYRYRLWRTLSITNERRLLIIALNPSTAGERANDPTIRREIAFALRDGFGVLDKCNLFSWRATDPSALGLQVLSHGKESIVGPDTDDTICAAAAHADRIICAWGSDKILKPHRCGARVDDVLALLSGHDLYVFAPPGKPLAPRHPLYLAGDCPVALWRPRASAEVGASV